MQESNFNVIIDTENYNAVIGESAKIDVGQAISNVQSGKAEIQAAVQDGKAAFNLNATTKTGEFNNNASAKTQDYNDNAVAKTTAFNDNATAKTSSFDTNATNKTNAFNQNATDKTLAFNNNAAAKQAEVDASAVLAKQYAIGDPSEPTGNSAKYWAEQASSSVTGLGARVTAIEGKIPADASSSNQLADKSWVESQEYITGITSSDVTNALGYTPYNSTNPNGYITGISSSDVTTALGYTPYNSTNPNGYTSNVGTVTSVNNTAPDSSGNVTLIIPDSLPSQTGHSGEFLTTDGTDASWGSPDLSGKADVDLSNVNNTGKSLGAGWAMPSDTYDDLTLGASGASYQAPANGWYYISKVSGTSGAYVSIRNATTRMNSVTVRASSNGQWLESNLPVKKGDTVEVDYTATGATNYFRFIYAVGSEWEKTNV